MSERLLRRDFVLRLATLTAAGMLPAQVGSADLIKNAPWIAVKHASKFKPQIVEHIVLPDSANNEEIYVSVNQDGVFSALWSRCTHQGCIVNWKASAKQFVCPCHGGRFDNTGMVISGPPQKPLRSLAVKVDTDGMLYVQLPA